LDLVGRISRDEYEGLLGAMVQSRLIELEEAEFEKEGQIIRFRKVRLTEDGRQMRPEDSMQLLISDGVVEEFAGSAPAPSRTKTAKAATQKASPGSVGSKTAVAAEPIALTAAGEALAARIREWRAAEAKRLKVPAYVVLHERTLLALAEARPKNPNELLVIDGIGPAKVERFGEELLRLCAGK
jgi:superfamily II DNA helicase RecQ